MTQTDCELCIHCTSWYEDCCDVKSAFRCECYPELWVSYMTDMCPAFREKEGEK